jgi:hypothetical protein
VRPNLTRRRLDISPPAAGRFARLGSATSYFSLAKSNVGALASCSLVRLALSRKPGREPAAYRVACRMTPPSSDHGRGNRIQESDQARFCGPPSRLAHNRDGTKDARQGYLSSQTSSMRQLLIMLLTIIVHPFTCGCQQYATRL